MITSSLPVTFYPVVVDLHLRHLDPGPGAQAAHDEVLTALPS